MSYFSVAKSTKSQQGGLTPSSFRTSCGVHELVARAMRGKCVRDGVKAKVSSFALTTTSTIPRVRTYRTKEPSRFVHALPARPLKVQGGRGSGTCADGIKILTVIGTSSVSLWLPPSPTGEGLSNTSAQTALIKYRQVY